MNISDVAYEAGVSIATVSRVINNADYPVRPETRDRVLVAIKKLGFRPNDLARGLLLRRTRTVGLIVPDITNPYYPALTRGVEDVASEQLYAVIFCNTDRNVGKAEHYVNTLLQKRVDGIIIAGGGTDFTWATRTFTEFGAEVVFIGRHGAERPSVQVDNVAAAQLATGHLARLGHTEIATITGPLVLTSAQDRLEGHRRALTRARIGWDDRLVVEGDFQEPSGHAATRALLAGHPRPTAIFAANDRMAIGAMAAVADTGLRVPDDVSIVGFDDTSLASYVRPALTTVRVPTYDLGAAAMRLLLARVQGGADAAADDVLLECELVVRGSAAAPPAPAAEVPARPQRRRRAG